MFDYGNCCECLSSSRNLDSLNNKISFHIPGENVQPQPFTARLLKYNDGKITTCKLPLTQNKKYKK